MSHKRINHESNEEINVALCANPSHLEAVDPVVARVSKLLDKVSIFDQNFNF